MFEVKPVAGEDYEGRQWGFVIERDGNPVWHVTTGSTGICWNLEDNGDRADNTIVPLHICDLDGLIEALEALRDSQAHADNVQRWS